MSKLHIYKEIYDLILTAEKIYNSDASWEVKYDLIFDLDIWQTIKKDTNLHFTWSDPDCDYEDDVRAYMNALIEFKKGFGSIFKEENSDGIPELND